MEMFKHELSGHVRKKNQFEHTFMFSLITCREDWYDALYSGPYNNINISRGHFNQVLNEERHLWNKKVIIYEIEKEMLKIQNKIAFSYKKKKTLEKPQKK